MTRPSRLRGRSHAAASLSLGLAASLSLGVAALLVEGPAAGAQSDAPLDLVCQTAVVGDQPATIEIRTTGAADDAQLAVRVLRPVRDVDTLLETYDEPVRSSRISLFGGLLSEFAATTPSEPTGATPPETTTPPTPSGCSEPGADTTGRYVITIPDDEVGELLRRDAGALPVVIDLLEDGRVVDTLVTALLVVPPNDEDDEPRLRLGFVGELHADLAHLPDQTVRSPFSQLAEPLAQLEQLTGLPVSLALRPETLRAMSLTEGDAALAPIVALAASHPPLLEPWVDLDEEAWRQVGESDMVIAQYAEGRSAVEGLIGVSPSAVVRLDPDATPDTVGLLRAAGANLVLLDAASVSGSTDAREAHGPVHLLDDNGVTMVALVVDAGISTTLAGDDTELAAHRALAELSLLQAAAVDDQSVVVDVTSIDAATILTLVDAIADHRDIDVATLPELFDTPLARTDTGAIVEAQLSSDRVGDLSTAAERLRAARADAVAYATMITSTDAPIAPLRRLLLAAAANGLDPDARQRYTDAVSDEVRRGTSGITIVEADRITLASRTADLPLTVRNEQSVTVTAELLVRAEKLRFPDGDRRIVDLEPGDNHLVVRVETRASGDARVTATLVSPDGRLQIGSTVIQIRSTALSGLGLLISAIALAVLLVWWIRTVRRTRAARGAATVAGSVREAEPDPGGTGTGTREEL